MSICVYCGRNLQNIYISVNYNLSYNNINTWLKTVRNVFCDRAEFDNRSEPTAIYFVHNDYEKIIFDRTKQCIMALLKRFGVVFGKWSYAGWKRLSCDTLFKSSLQQLLIRIILMIFQGTPKCKSAYSDFHWTVHNAQEWKIVQHNFVFRTLFWNRKR